MELVSVIIPSFNPNVINLVAAIQSVFNQTYTNVEIVIGDDGSAISINDLLSECGMEFSNPHEMQWKVVRAEMNQGIAAARNMAIRSASGAWLCWLDDDDLLEHDCIEKLIEKSANRDLIIGECKVTEDGKICLRKPRDYFVSAKKYFRTEKDPFLLNIISLQPQLLRKSVFDDLGGFNEDYRFAELTEFFLRFLLSYGLSTIDFIEGAYYDYDRGKPESLSKHRTELFAYREKALTQYMNGISVRGKNIQYVGRDKTTGMQKYTLINN